MYRAHSSHVIRNIRARRPKSPVKAGASSVALGIAAMVSGCALAVIVNPIMGIIPLAMWAVTALRNPGKKRTEGFSIPTFSRGKFAAMVGYRRHPHTIPGFTP